MVKFKENASIVPADTISICKEITQRFSKELVELWNKSVKGEFKEHSITIYKYLGDPSGTKIEGEFVGPDTEVPEVNVGWNTTGISSGTEREVNTEEPPINITDGMVVKIHTHPDHLQMSVADAEKFIYSRDSTGILTDVDGRLMLRIIKDIQEDEFSDMRLRKRESVKQQIREETREKGMERRKPGDIAQSRGLADVCEIEVKDIRRR